MNAIKTNHRFITAQTYAVEPKKKPEAVTFPPAGVGSFGFDAALPPSAVPAFRATLRGWESVRAAWRAQIASEELCDVEINHYRTATQDCAFGFRLRTSDGGFRRNESARAVAYTEHAWAQLIALLMQEIPGKPRSPAEAYRWLDPTTRSEVFDSLVRRSVRQEGANHPILLRSYTDPRAKVRALRAVVSGRHSGVHFDDAALIEALSRIVPADAGAYVDRTPNFTRGYAVLDSMGAQLPVIEPDQAPSLEAHAAISWSNSETGCGSLGFAGSVYIHALAALVKPNVQTEVVITQQSERTRRAHTLPRKDKTDAERREIAQQRMADDLVKTAEMARELVAAWRGAQKIFADDAASAIALDPAAAAQVVLDVIAEHTDQRLLNTHIEQLHSVLETSKTLPRLPFLSAAHIAGAWAVLAHTTEDWKLVDDFQAEAFRWITKPFGRVNPAVIAHRAAVAEKNKRTF